MFLYMTDMTLREYIRRRRLSLSAVELQKGNIPGITSKGSVAPEKISMGKYKRQAITLAIFSFFAMPPTSIPMLKILKRFRVTPISPVMLLGVEFTIYVLYAAVSMALVFLGGLCLVYETKDDQYHNRHNDGKNHHVHIPDIQLQFCF